MFPLKKDGIPIQIHVSYITFLTPQILIIKLVCRFQQRLYVLLNLIFFLWGKVNNKSECHHIIVNAIRRRSYFSLEIYDWQQPDFHIIPKTVKLWSSIWSTEKVWVALSIYILHCFYWYFFQFKIQCKPWPKLIAIFGMLTISEKKKLFWWC